MTRTGVILVLALGACSTAPGAAAPPKPALNSGPDWQAVSEPAPGQAPELRHLCRRISHAEAAAKAPLSLDLTPIAADAPDLRGLGVLAYRGQGVEIRSDDPRFAALEIAPGRVLPRLPNGDVIQVDGYVPLGPGDDAARCFAPWNPTDLHDDIDVAPAVPATVRAQLGRRPDLRLIGAAPLGLRAWLALTTPQATGGRTVLIRIATDGARSPEVVAELPFAFQVIQPQIDLHSPRRWVRLVGRDGPDGPIRVMVVEVPPALM